MIHWECIDCNIGIMDSDLEVLGCCPLCRRSSGIFGWDDEE